MFPMLYTRKQIYRARFLASFLNYTYKILEYFFFLNENLY